MSTPVRIDAVSAGYGSSRVLDGFTLDIPVGEMLALVGPSGCGKTTVLKVIAGLVPVERGEVWFGDQRITAIAAERRGIAMVFQKPLLFPHMSVAENVGFGLAMRMPRSKHRDHRSTIADALRAVQLDGFGERRPSSLSGGQEQRVALARALITRPRVLLLDEPLSALDENLRVGMRALVRDLQRRLGITTVFVTHDQREAADMGDRVALLLSGRLAQSGPPRDFYTVPATADVARFFGWCVLDGTRNGAGFNAGGGVFDAPEHGEGRELGAVGFHPSTVRLSPPEPASAVNALPAVVEHVTDLGVQRRVTARLASGERLDIVQAVDRSTAPVVPGPAQLEIAPAFLRFFSRG